MRVISLIAALCVSAALIGSAGAKTTARAKTDGDTGARFGDYLAARFAAGNHDIAEAAKYFRASLQRDRDNPLLLNAAFLYAASAGQIEEAAKLAERVAINLPDDRTVRLTLAVAAMKRNDFKTAREQINMSAKGPFVSFTVALIDCWSAAGEGDRAAAEDILRRLHTEHDADGITYFNEAMLAEYFDKDDAAAAYYKQAYDTTGPLPRVAEAYGRFLERHGRAAEAREIYERLVREGGFGAVAGPGMLRIAKGTIPSPMISRPHDAAAEALFLIAASLNDEPSREMSILYLQLALALQPDHDLSRVLLANRYESLAKFDEAISTYQKIESGSPFYKLASVAIAVNEVRLNKTDKAIATLQKIAADHPADVETWTALGDSYRQMKKYPEAITSYDRAIMALNPPTKRNWALFYARAGAAQESGNWPQAEADLKRALELSPNEPALLNFLGYSWVDAGQNVREAVSMLEKARALAPQDGYIIDSVGWAYYKLGRYEEAAETLEQAVQLVPGDPTINDHLGDAYWKVGRKLDAQFQWSHALAFGAEAGDKAKIEKKLQMAQQ